MTTDLDKLYSELFDAMREKRNSDAIMDAIKTESAAEGIASEHFDKWHLLQSSSRLRAKLDNSLNETLGGMRIPAKIELSKVYVKPLSAEAAIAATVVGVAATAGGYAAGKFMSRKENHGTWTEKISKASTDTERTR